MRRTLNILWNIFRLASIDNFISLLSPVLTFVFFCLNWISCEFFLWYLNIIRCITSSFYADWLYKSFDGTKLFMCGSARFDSVWFNFVVIATIKFKMIEIRPLFFHFDGLIYLLENFFSVSRTHTLRKNWIERIET